MAQKPVKDKGITKASQAVPIPESTMRRLDKLGIVKAARDPWGRRLFGDDDIEAARKYVQARHQRLALSPK